MQLLNIMKNLKNNREIIIDMLYSEDYETRKLGESFLLEIYNLDFEIWKDIDWKDLTYNYHFYFPIDEKHIPIHGKLELHLIVLHGGYEKIEISRFINIICEYNGEIK